MDKNSDLQHLSVCVCTHGSSMYVYCPSGVRSCLYERLYASMVSISSRICSFSLLLNSCGFTCKKHTGFEIRLALYIIFVSYKTRPIPISKIHHNSHTMLHTPNLISYPAVLCLMHQHMHKGFTKRKTPNAYLE